MSTTKAVRWVEDSISIPVYSSDLTKKKSGLLHNTAERDIAHSDGLKWWIQWNSVTDIPLGPRVPGTPDGYISLRLYVNQPVSIKYNIRVHRSFIQASKAYDFKKAGHCWIREFATHEALRNVFNEDRITIICDVVFEVPVSLSIRPHCLLHYSGHLQTDFVFIVGTDRIHTYKCFLSLLSPDLNALVSEAAETVITDFNYETVKAAIDYCSGKKLQNLSVEIIIDIYRFGGHYKIDAITKELEVELDAVLSNDTVCIIAYHANNTENHSVFAKCCEFFKQNFTIIKTKESFTKLSPKFATQLFKTAFNLETDPETFDCAQRYGLNIIADYLEPSISESLSLSNFCSHVILAINKKREVLKKACGKFYEDHQTELCSLEPFCALSLDKNILTTKEWITGLPVSLVMHLLKSTLKLPTEFDVLDYAYNNGFKFDWDDLERPLLQSVTLDNFCSAVGYAWKCSRDGLKKVCAKFYSDNLLEIMKLKQFAELPAETTHALLQFRFEYVNILTLE